MKWAEIINEDDSGGIDVSNFKKQIIQMLVALKSQNISEVPLDKFINELTSQYDDLDPESDTDLKFILDIFSQIPIISRYDVATNKLVLDMPKPEASDASDEQKKDSGDEVADIAKKQATKKVQGEK